MFELKEKMAEMFVDQLIHYQENDNEINEHLLQYAKLLEFDIHTNRVCLLVDLNILPKKISTKKESNELFGSFPFQYFQREVLSFLRLIFHENKDDIVSFLNFERFIVIVSLPYKQSFPFLLEGLEEKLEKINSFLETKYHVSASLAVGDISNTLAGISISYQNALKAMNIGLRFEKESSIHVYKERETLLRMLPGELTSDYQKKLLKLISSLIEHDSYDVLSSTFIGFCKYNMNLSEASRNMFIHRNTIIYRLEKISEITSLNTSSFEHCMLLYTAIQYFEETKGKSKVLN
jgi:carbohydrate diacid regulator